MESHPGHCLVASTCPGIRDADAEGSLAALSAIVRRLRDDLSRVADPEVQASLLVIGAARGAAESTLTCAW